MSLLYINDRRGAYPESWYTATAEPLPHFPELKGETRADVAIVGGGFTGLSAALHLAELGYDVALVEAQRVGFGASGRNGGQVGVGQRQDQEYLEQHHGTALARELWQIGLDSVALVKDLIARHGIDAEWRDGIAWAARTPAIAAEYQAYAEHLAQVYSHTEAAPLSASEMRAIIGSEAVHGGMIDRASGHMHPLRFALGLARVAQAAGVRIYEGTEAHRVADGQVQTARGRIRAEQIVLAGNGYLAGLDRRTEARVMPLNNFIIATEPLGARAQEVLAEDIAVADSRFVVNYWRLSHDGRLLFGGGESYGRRFPRDIVAKVRKPMLALYPQLADTRIDYAWGGTLGITKSRLPVFDRPKPGLWTLGGYSGHGVALATLAGQIVARAIHGDMGRFDTMARIRPAPLPPLGPLRTPALALAMMWYALRDRLAG